MKTQFSHFLILLIFSILVSTFSFGQDLKKEARSSVRIKSAVKQAGTLTINDQNTKYLRSFLLSSKFHSAIKNAKLDEIDTLNFPLVGTYTIYSSGNGGYVTGNNGWYDKAKANKFVIPQACQLTGILFGFYKATGGPANIEIAVWDNSGENNIPGEIINSTTVSLSSIQNDISNNQMTYVAFDEPITITTTFYAGIILPASAGDTLVIWSNTDGDVVPGTAWEQQSDNSWYPMFHQYSWGRNLVQAIFPIVEYNDLPLMADFMASPTHIQPEGSVTFTDLSTGNPISRLWTFEGGYPATSTEPNLVVVYEEEGTYDVTLTVENDTAQDTKTVEDYITVANSIIEVDTLNYPLQGQYVYYVSDSGYFSGNNSYGDLAKANYFSNVGNKYITELLFEFAIGTGGVSSVEFAVWNSNGANNSPGSKIAFQMLPLDGILEDISTQSFTHVVFNTPVLVNGSFYAGVMLPTTTGDTLVVWSNQNGETDPGIAWELWENNEWYTFKESYGQDVALAIFPIVQNTLNVNEFSESRKLHVLPNPSDGHFIIDLTENMNMKLHLEIFNISGKRIWDRTFGNRTNSISCDISEFPAGVYMLKVTDGKETYSQKILKK